MIQITVGPGKAYPSIQAAINTIIQLAVANGGYIPDSIEIIVYENKYGGFIVPSNSVGTSSTNTILIKAAPNNRVEINGNILSPSLGHGYNSVGIGIGDNNPYISLRGIEVRDFLKGIVYSANSNYFSIQSCKVFNNANAGIWIYRANNGSILNSISLDNGFNLAISEVDDITCVSNDLVRINETLNPTTDEKCNVYITTTTPNSSSPPGSLVFYNNNIVSLGGKLICYGNNVLSKLRSDFNNIYNPNGIIAHSINTASTITDAYDLASWQTISKNDLNSKSIFLDHYIPAQYNTYIDLNNYSLYGGIGMGINNLCNLSTASTTGGLITNGYIPSYVDTSLLCETIQSNFSTGTISRPNPPSIGAFDSNYSINNFGDSFLFLLTGNLYSPCGLGSNNGLIKIEEKYGQSVDCIIPSVVPGFFYAHDAQYYLYSDKAAYKLSDITVTDIVLAVSPESVEYIKINDTEISSDNYKVDGNVLRIYHRNLDINDLYRTCEAKVYFLKWADNGFTKKSIIQNFRLADGVTKYFLPNTPTRAAPIVITDDKINYSDDPKMLGQQFTIKWNEEEEKPELLFNNYFNHIENSQFDYINTESSGRFELISSEYKYAPADWMIITGEALCYSKITNSHTGLTEVVGASGSYTGYSYSGLSTGSYDLYPLIGSYFCVLSGEISQRIRVSEFSPYISSLYCAAIKSTGSSYSSVTGHPITMDFTCYDIEMRRLTGGFSFTSSKISTDYSKPTGHWTRLSEHINQVDPEGFDAYFTKDTYYVDFTISTTGAMAIDAVMLNESNKLDPYYRRIRGNEATIEYDTGVTDLYHVDDLTLTPIRNRNSNGFLYIGPIPARQFDINAPINTTTLTDWGWSTGRLEYLPWAKTSGKNKLRLRGEFTSYNSGVTEDVTLNPKISYPDLIQIIPRVPVALLEEGKSVQDVIINSGNVGIAGTDFTIKVTDTNSNPYSFEWVDVSIVNDVNDIDNRNYVGLIGNRNMGFYTEFSDTLTAQLDSAGATSLRWIPPSPTDVMHEITNQSSIFYDSDNDPYIRLNKYRINEVGHGNAFVSFPSNPNGFSKVNTNTFETFNIGPWNELGNNNSKIRIYNLQHTPYSDSVEVYTNHTGDIGQYDLKLTQSSIPEISDGQFFVDELRRLLFVRWNGTTNDLSRGINVKYYKRNYFLKSNIDGVYDPYSLYLENDFVDTLISKISPNNPCCITYDIKIDMIVKAKSPIGMSVEFVTVPGPGGTTETINARERNLNTTLVGRNLNKRVGYGSI